MQKNKTNCCALAHLSGLSNTTTKKEIKTQLKSLKKEALKGFIPGDNSGLGQTSVFTIVTPSENKLTKKLVKVGFKECHTFKRRVGYPQTGNLRMLIYNLL